MVDFYLDPVYCYVLVGEKVENLNFTFDKGMDTKGAYLKYFSDGTTI